MNKKTTQIKTVVFLVMSIVLITITATAQLQTESVVFPKILLPVTNTGPTVVTEAITFSTACAGKDIRLVVCRENALCNAITQPKDLLCISSSSNESGKYCSYIPYEKDLGLHKGGVATCCNLAGECDTNSLLIDEWEVSLFKEGEVALIDENNQQIQTEATVLGNITSIAFTDEPYKGLLFETLNGTPIGFSTTARGIVEPEGVTFTKTFALDLEKITFEKGTFITKADASNLYKCNFWDFELSICLGSWDFVKVIQPTIEYSIDLAIGTIAFAEANNLTQQDEPQIDKDLVVSTVENNGPVVQGEQIDFTGSCAGLNTRLIICRDSISCNSLTSPEDIICISTISNESKKSCTYKTSQLDAEINNNDIATCCNTKGDCAASTTVIKPWIAREELSITPITEISSEDLVQEQAEVAKPVKWIKKVRLDQSTTNIKVKTHPSITNITIQKITNNIKQELLPATWNVQETTKETEITITEEVQDFNIEYYTAPPTIKEEFIHKYKKRVIIDSPIHYTNIIATTNVPEVPQQYIRVYQLTNGTKQRITNLTYKDTTNSGFIDTVVWIVPSLSNRTYIIEITKADHLDQNRNFISDIYSAVITLDNNWSETIPNNDYVRIVFEQELTSSKDITVFPRIVTGNPKIEVYEINGTTLIAEFTSLTENQYNKVLLTSLIGSQDTFDLKIVGGSVEFNHIIDPEASPVGDTALRVQQCDASDRNAADTFTDACDSSGYPAACGDAASTLDEVSCNDGIYERTLTRTTNFAGLRVNISNTAITNCASVESVLVCIDWFGSQTMNNCALDVDANGGEGFTEVNTNCPPTSDGGTVCTNITALAGETFDCNTFFGPTAAGAMARTQAQKNSGGGNAQLDHDALFFNVSYTETADTTPPSFSNLIVTPNASNYSLTQFYEFNVTVTDVGGVDEVIITFNGTNFSSKNSDVYNLGSVFSFNRTGLAAANYTYRWSANDTSVNRNETLLQSLVVSRAVGVTNLTLDGTYANISVNAGSNVNSTATVIAGEASLQLFRDGVALSFEGDAASSITNISTYAAGGPYNITTFLPQSENFTVNFTTWYVNIITPDTEPPGFITHLTVPVNASLYSPSQFYEFNVTVVDTDSAIDTVILTFNNTNYSTTVSTVYNLSTVFSFNFSDLAASKYQYVWHANDSLGNSNLSGTKSFTVLRASNGTSFTLAGVVGNASVVADTEVNATATRFVSEGSNLQLFRDGVALTLLGDIAFGVTNSSIYETGGPYNITSFYPESENFTANYSTHYVNIVLPVTQNNPPNVTNVNLAATTITNVTTANLTVTMEVTDPENDTTYNITDWRLEGNSIAVLNMPFDLNVSSTALGEVHDHSTYGDNGTLIGDTFWDNDANCKIGGCYVFDGDGDYINVINADSINTLQVNMTITGWFNVGSINVRPIVFSQYSDTTDHKLIKLVRLSESTRSLNYFMSTTGGTFQSFEMTADYFLDEWVFFAVRVNGTLANPTLLLRINDTSENFAPAALSTTPDPTTEIRIGWSQHANADEDLNGMIDNIVVYNRSLSDQQLDEIYNAGKLNLSITTLRNNETKIGDNWTVAVTSSDFKNESTTVISHNLEILALVTLNNPPNVTSLVLNASSSGNVTTDNLTVYFDVVDVDNNATYNITDWRLEGDSIAVLNMPFNLNVTSTATGVIRDYSSYGNNGTLNNVPLWNSSGKVGGAYYFDNTNQIALVDHDSLDIVGNITLSAWIMPHVDTPSESHNIIVAKTVDVDTISYLFGQGSALSRQLDFTFTDQSFGFVQHRTVANVLTLNEWQHVVVTYNGTTVLMYVNGSIVLDAAETSVMLARTDPAWIGGTTSANRFKGLIDEVMIFNQTLTSEQISSMYKDGLENHSIDTIVSQETTVGDNWTVAVTSTDFKNESTTVISHNLEILAAAGGNPTVVGGIYSSSVTIPSQSVTENGITEMLVSFTVSDVDGVGDIDDSTANLTLRRSLVGVDGALNNVSTNTTCFAESDVDANTANYTCTVQLHYWFDPAEWNLTAGILDISGVASVNHTNFTVVSTSAIVVSLSSFDFGTLTIGTENSTATSPIVVNNTANAGVLSVSVLAVDLVGEVIVSDTIGANNFSVDVDTGGIPPLECTAATELVNASAIAVVGSVLASGNRSFGEGNETLYPCFRIVPFGLSAQAYSTLNGTAWTVSI